MSETDRTPEQHQVLSAWAAHGAEHFLHKLVSGGWTVTVAGVTTPSVFRRKRAALAHAEARVAAFVAPRAA